MVKTIGNVEGEGFVTTTGVIIAPGIGLLGEIRQIALSMTGALTKADLQGYGWAICDGTTPESQGISSPTITTTPDLREKFLRHSADETTGGTGGSATHNHTFSGNTGGMQGQTTGINNYDQGGTHLQHHHTYSGTTSSVGTLPPYYDICYFMKVK